MKLTFGANFLDKLICDLIQASVYTVKLGIKELSKKEQSGNSEPFPVTNLSVYFINNEQPGIIWDEQRVPYS